VVFDFPHHFLLLFFLGEQGLFEYCFVVLSFGFLLDALFELLASVFEGAAFVVVAVVEAADDVGFRHEFLHFQGEVGFAGILDGVETFDYFLGCDGGTM
jgi:hypothetical protein